MANSSYLVEQLTLEIFGVNRHLERLKDSFGIVTQWESGAWLIVQFLAEQGRCRMNTLLQEQHISEAHAQHLLNELLEAGLVKGDEHHPAIHAHYELTPNGESALLRLREAMKPGFEQFEDDFDQAKLATAIEVLQTYRHRLECIKLSD